MAYPYWGPERSQDASPKKEVGMYYIIPYDKWKHTTRQELDRKVEAYVGRKIQGPIGNQPINYVCIDRHRGHAE